MYSRAPSAAVGQPHPVALHLEQRAVEDELAGDEMLGQILVFRHLERRDGDGAEVHQRPGHDAEEEQREAVDRQQHPRRCAGAAAGAASLGSSKYISLTMRR